MLLQPSALEDCSTSTVETCNCFAVRELRPPYEHRPRVDEQQISLRNIGRKSGLFPDAPSFRWNQTDCSTHIAYLPAARTNGAAMTLTLTLRIWAYFAFSNF